MPEVLDKATLKALSTETRQDILKMLKNRPYTASELSKLLNKHVTTITEHLDLLEKSGVVRKKDSTNKWVYYTLSDKGEKLFKPYYSWVLMFSLSIIAFIAGIYQFTFVGYQASALTIPERAAPAAAEVPQQAAAVNINIITGIALLVIAVFLLWMAMRRRRIKVRPYNINY